MPVILPNDIHSVTVPPFTTQGSEFVPMNFISPDPTVVGGIDRNGVITGLSLAAAGGTLSGAVILSPATSARNVVQGTTDAIVPLILKWHSVTQTGDLFQAQNNAGTVLLRVDKTGSLFSNEIGIGPLGAVNTPGTYPVQ